MRQKRVTPAGTPKIDRRSFIRAAATAATTVCFAATPVGNSSIAFGGDASKPPFPTSPDGQKAPDVSAGVDAMEQALETLAGLAPLTNHGPMAAEALVALGRPDAVKGFVEKYKKRFTAVAPEAYRPITRENWRSALGDGARVTDWTNFFNRELKEAPWSQVLDQWVAALAPGMAAAAGHGLIRTGHAARSLSIKESELRRRELGEGLGYWAAYYQTLPSPPGDSTSGAPGKNGLRPAQALRQVPLVPEERRSRSASIMNGLRSLDSFQPFAGVMDLIEAPVEPARFLSELTETFATAYLSNVSGRNLLPLIHTVTSATALRSLLPLLAPDTARRALRYSWQTSAALYSTYANSTVNPPESKEIRREELIARAVDSYEEHAIKFTEACLGEYALNPKPAYLQAARDALNRINPV
jgi:hypothetical protein